MTKGNGQEITFFPVVIQSSVERYELAVVFVGAKANLSFFRRPFSRTEVVIAESVGSEILVACGQSGIDDIEITVTGHCPETMVSELCAEICHPIKIDLG